MTDRTVSVRLKANVTDYMAKFSAAGKAAGDLAGKVDKATGRTKQGIDHMGRGMLIAGGAIAAGFAVAEKKFMDFDAQMAQVRTLSHATSGDMSKLRDAALHMGNGIGFSATQVADAETELVKAGISVKDILGGALTGALTLAAAGQTDVAEATETAAIAMTQFKLTGKDVPHIADLLSAGADKALGSVHDLSYGLKQGGLVASQFGLSIEDTVGTLAAFAQAGLIGEQGGTVLRQMLLQLAAPSKQAAGVMKDLGLHVYDAAGQFVGITGLAGQLHEKMVNLTPAVRNADMAIIFGAHSIQGANVLYAEGAAGLQGWIDTVNDSGFAALQAAGKMDSLKGDLSKFKAEINTAFIETGSQSSGMFRGVIQDLTGVVHAYNGLPGPLHEAATAAGAVAAAITLAGGAALISIPKFAALNASLKELTGGAVTARTAMSGIGRGGIVAAGIFGIVEAATALEHAMSAAPPDVDKLTRSLIDLASVGAVSGELKKAFGPGLRDLGEELRAIADPSVNQRIKDTLHSVFFLGHDDPQLREASKDFEAIDQALANLVTSGHLQDAQRAWMQLVGAAKSQGISVTDLANRLPQYGQALNDSAASSKTAADGVDQFGNNVAQAIDPVKALDAAVKGYNDTLHALADPLFAMNKAVQDLADKQHAAAKATRKYGADSRQARQANLDLASSALEVEVAATTLAGAVKDGSVSLATAKSRLREWTRAGIITKAQADDIAASFGGLINQANTLGGKHIRVKVDADTAAARYQLMLLDSWLNRLSSTSHTVHENIVVSGPGHAAQQPNLASGGPIRGPGSGTSDSIPARLSNGEFVVRADGSNLGDAMRFFGAPGFADGGSVNAYRIATGVMTGNLPASVDKLSAEMRQGLNRLSNVVQSAQQYRSQAKSSLMGYADISGAVGSGVSVVAYERAKANDLERFSKLYNRLAHRHLNPTMLDAFLQAGPAAIPAMQELLRTPGAIHTENQLQRRVGRTSTMLAGQATQDQFGPKIERAVQALPGPIGKAVGKAVAHELRHLTIHIDSGGRQVAHMRRTG